MNGIISIVTKSHTCLEFGEEDFRKKKIIALDFIMFCEEKKKNIEIINSFSKNFRMKNIMHWFQKSGR